MAKQSFVPATPVTVVSRSSTTATAVVTDSNSLPFHERTQLCRTLSYHTDGKTELRHLRSHEVSQRLPDCPRIFLNSCNLVAHCLKDLDTPGMNKLGKRLWWTGPSLTINPLSEQLTIGRKMQLTEDPSLHCVWTDDLMFVKPLPAYICSYAFWEYLLDASSETDVEEREQLRATSLGFLKSYASLIQRRSDFNIARRLELLASLGDVSFEDFVEFISSFDTVPDSAVSHRWRFGELVLDALNFHSVLALHRWHKNRYEARYGAYFQRFFPMVLFIFAFFTVALSAMQVILSAESMKGTDNKGLEKTIRLFIWFGTEAIGWTFGFAVLFVIWWIWISAAEGWRRRKTMKRAKKSRAQEAAVQP